MTYNTCSVLFRKTTFYFQSIRIFINKNNEKNQCLKKRSMLQILGISSFLILNNLIY